MSGVCRFTLCIEVGIHVEEGRAELHLAWGMRPANVARHERWRGTGRAARSPLPSAATASGSSSTHIPIPGMGIKALCCVRSVLSRLSAQQVAQTQLAQHPQHWPRAIAPAADRGLHSQLPMASQCRCGCTAGTAAPPRAPCAAPPAVRGAAQHQQVSSGISVSHRTCWCCTLRERSTRSCLQSCESHKGQLAAQCAKGCVSREV